MLPLWCSTQLFLNEKKRNFKFGFVNWKISDFYQVPFKLREIALDLMTKTGNVKIKIQSSSTFQNIYINNFQSDFQKKGNMLVFLINLD